MFIGLVLIAIGVIALLVKLGVLAGSIWNYTWPVILIILGLLFISALVSDAAPDGTGAVRQEKIKTTDKDAAIKPSGQIPGLGVSLSTCHPVSCSSG